MCVCMFHSLVRNDDDDVAQFRRVHAMLSAGIGISAYVLGFDCCSDQLRPLHGLGVCALNIVSPNQSNTERH